MLFIEFRFFVFYAIVFSVAWLLHSNTARKGWLLACSHFFYACFFVGPPLQFAHLVLARHFDQLPAGWWFPFVLIGSICMDYLVGLNLGSATSPGRRKAWLLVSLCVNLGVLAWFKYFNFFLTSSGAFLGWIGLPVSVHTLNIILPYGVSFYTFQSMSYSMEVYRRHIEPERRFLDLAFFVSFFPQLVAGPIVRSTTFLPQTKQTRRWNTVDVRGALVLFLSGFIKKACIASSVSPYVDRYFADPAAYTAGSAWLAVPLYAVQIYCDFSGYTDMAIACARLLGYELTINFNFPYFARNVTEFWHRWHISLSTWLRDYLYIPLGGNRGSLAFTYRNLMLTMLLGGLWHGAAWGFVVWGALHGLALIVHRESVRRRRGAGPRQRHEPSSALLSAVPQIQPAWHSKPSDILSTALTFCFVCFCWAWFRSPNFHIAITVTKALLFFHSGSAQLEHSLALLFIILAVIHWFNWKGAFVQLWRPASEWTFAAGYGAAFALTLLFVPQHYSPFIYFGF